MNAYEVLFLANILARQNIIIHSTIDIDRTTCPWNINTNFPRRKKRDFRIFIFHLLNIWVRRFRMNTLSPERFLLIYRPQKLVVRSPFLKCPEYRTLRIQTQVRNSRITTNLNINNRSVTNSLDYSIIILMCINMFMRKFS